MAKQKKLIVANWKMNPSTHTDATILFRGILKHAAKLKRVQAVVCPPFVFLERLAFSVTGTKVLFGGQDLFYAESGKFTGEVSAAQLYSVGADYCILGHSERRALGETDEDVQAKIKMALVHKLTPIVCIGESERDSHGKYLSFIRRQLVTSLKKIKTKEISKVVIAYEPIWAIGSIGSSVITPGKLHETILFIRRVLRETYNAKIAERAQIIYGGSANGSNSKELILEGKAQGFLVGGASLNAGEFGKILKIANNLS